MPNWCSNDLFIYGPQRLEIADYISGGEAGVIDFNKIIPMPEILKGSTSGSLESEARVFAGLSSGAAMLTYPWVREAGVRDLPGLKQLLVQRNPEVAKLGMELQRMKAETGYTSWYEWCCNSWGTKWNSSEGVRDDQRTRICLTFDTAWSPPMPIVDGLSEMYPKTKFSLRYYEAGMGFKGHYAMKGGGVVAKQYTEGYRGGRGG